MEESALAVQLGIGDHRQVIFQTYPVREPPHRPGRSDEVPELMSAIQRSGVVVDVIMNVLAVCMGGNEKGILALRPAHGRFIAHPICILRGDLSGLERLPDLIAQHIGIPPLLPARGGLVLGLGEQELRIGGHVVAGIGGNQFAALGLVRVFAVVKTAFQRLGDGFPLADLVLLEIGRCRRQPSFPYEKGRLLPAAADNFGTSCPKVSAGDEVPQGVVEGVEPRHQPVSDCRDAIGGNKERQHKEHHATQRLAADEQNKGQQGQHHAAYHTYRSRHAE
ncbi:relaxase/Mobilization nuclease domain protein [Clostridioides difficile CD40]|nr:relaxase/Mobilization nuclease domain protein [Clostridioides difficile CD40]